MSVPVDTSGGSEKREWGGTRTETVRYNWGLSRPFNRDVYLIHVFKYTFTSSMADSEHAITGSKSEYLTSNGDWVEYKEGEVLPDEAYCLKIPGTLAMILHKTIPAFESASIQVSLERLAAEILDNAIAFSNVAEKQQGIQVGGDGSGPDIPIPNQG